MHAQSEEFPDPEVDYFTLTILVVFGCGVALGVKVAFLGLRLHRWWFGGSGEAKTQWSPEVELSPPGWFSLVVRALRFIRKRRRVSLAFNNYKSHPLRHSPTQTGWADQPSRGWLNRAGPGGRATLLREGPAIVDGSLRRRG